MNRVIQVIVLCASVFPVTGQDLEVTVKNIKNNKGVLVIGLFSSEKTFTKLPLKAEKPKAEAGTMKVIFQNVEPGDYAISIFHDANENAVLDMNFMGVPKEGFGFSNDAMGVFGPPTFNKAKFSCPASRSVSVTMKYF
jgi:uncharacterized protein (DUF2141 family)